MNAGNSNNWYASVPSSWYNVNSPLDLQWNKMKCRITGCDNMIHISRMYCKYHECGNSKCWYARDDNCVFCVKCNKH